MTTQSLTYPSGSLLAFEISQQPFLWPTTLERLESAAMTDALKGTPIILTGAGTSAYAGVAIAEACPGWRAIPSTDLLLSSSAEVAMAVPSFRDNGLLISLARSGDSPESVAVIAKFKKEYPAVRHLVIVCNHAGCLAQTAGVHVICLDPRTNDRSLAMTGSFSNLALAGLCLAYDQQIRVALPTVCARVEANLGESSRIAQEIARSCKDRVVILASAMQALAKESALKIVELTAGRVSAMPETFLGFRHGPVGFLREDTPVVCFLSSDPHKRLYEEDLIEDLRRRGMGRLVIVGNGVSARPDRGWSVPAAAPELSDALRTPFEIPFMQLLAYHLSVHAQVDPDNPSPDGAITRVVRTFRIHEE